MSKRKTVKKKKIRPLGDILLDLEPILLEMGIDHDLQWSDILSLVHVYLMVHLPTQQEIYKKDNSSPEFYYGPKRKTK